MAVKFDYSKCIRCAGCASVCPASALELLDKGVVCDAAKCINCGICIKVCPAQCISFADKEEE
ncbi:MAG: 4Fe-4S dicluster domain-containing protein [Candidatus Micrarchaeota archaeon]